jgi:hypothetical protein
MMQAHMLSNPKNWVVWDSEVVEAYSGTEGGWAGLFLSIGHEPATKFFKGSSSSTPNGMWWPSPSPRTPVLGRPWHRRRRCGNLIGLGYIGEVGGPDMGKERSSDKIFSFLTEMLPKLRFYESSTLSTPPNIWRVGHTWGQYGFELGEKKLVFYYRLR